MKRIRKKDLFYGIILFSMFCFLVDSWHLLRGGSYCTLGKMVGMGNVEQEPLVRRSAHHRRRRLGRYHKRLSFPFLALGFNAAKKDILAMAVLCSVRVTLLDPFSRSFADAPNWICVCFSSHINVSHTSIIGTICSKVG